MSAAPHTDRDPFAVMLRGAFLPTLAVGPVAVVVAAVVGGGKAALGAALGFTIAIVFFALGLLVMRRLGGASDPLRFLASALAVFMGQMIFLLLVIIALQDATWLDGTAFGLTVLAVAAGLAGLPGGRLRPFPPGLLSTHRRKPGRMGARPHEPPGAHRDHATPTSPRPAVAGRPRWRRPTRDTSDSTKRACGTSSPTSSRGRRCSARIGWGLDPGWARHGWSPWGSSGGWPCRCTSCGSGTVRSDFRASAPAGLRRDCAVRCLRWPAERFDQTLEENT